MARTNDSDYEKPRFSLATLFMFVAFVAYCSALLFAFHPAVVFIVDVGVLVVVILTLAGVRQIVGFAIPTLTVVEWLTIIGVVIMLNASPWFMMARFTQARRGGRASHQRESTLSLPRKTLRA